MLTKCPECSNDVSSAAQMCPKCGHPLGAAAPTSPAAPDTTLPQHKKPASTTAGWISIAAFVLANFTPAILAPILVLAAIIFAAKQLGSGKRTFGFVALSLALLQGWFVIDHFGHLSGSLGIVTAKDTDRTASAKYANTSLTLPSEWQDTARSKCREEWSNDYKMQEYCVQQQRDGAATLAQEAPHDVDPDAYRVIRGKCAEDWPRDFKMRAYCESQQIEGYRSLQSSTNSSSTRDGCAQQWPTDYKMRRYCESTNQ